MLGQTAPQDGGNGIYIASGVVAAALAAIPAIIAAYRKGQASTTTTRIEAPVPVITTRREYSPPTFHQHHALGLRVDKLETGMDQLRRDNEQQFRTILLAGEERMLRMLDKLDGVARGFHNRVDQLMKIKSDDTNG
jgi:hypothetical protein